MHCNKPNVTYLFTGPFGTNFTEILIKTLHIFIQENAIEIVVRELVAILPWP